VRAQLTFAAVALFLIMAAASSAADAPSLTVNDVTVTEGDAGTKNAVFTVMLSASSADPITVDFATADGSATMPDDYASTSGTLSFAPGELSKQVSVAVVGDTLDEPHETYTLNLSNPLGATIADARGAGTILDNDPLVSLSVDDVSASEGSGQASFHVSLSGASGKVITVAYATTDGSALAGNDYTSRAATLVFAAGETAKNVSVMLTDDQEAEPDETFALNLSNAVNATLADAQGVGTIVDDDAVETPPPPGDNPPPPEENPPPPPTEEPPPPPPPGEDPPPTVPPAGDPPPVEEPPAEEPPAEPENDAPDCSGVAPSPSRLWVPDHNFRLVTLVGADDPEGDPVSYEIGSVTQDEPAHFSPDAKRPSLRSDQVWLRTERRGKGDGRVYRLEYTASDDHGHSCGGTALVGVPHDWAHPVARDSGGRFDSFGF
jgi:Calx-beta domain